MNDYTVFQAHRPFLFSIAYRMLGSAAEAEDTLQDAYLRFQASSQTEVESPKAYLATIVTRLCLNQLQSARARRESYIGPWLPEPILNAQYPVNPEARLSDYESISLAFLRLLENLTPAERAVFLLHEVFDYPYEEIAPILEKSEAACRKLYSRAKAYLTQNRPRFTTTPEEHQRILEQFMQAVSEGDLAGLTTLLAENVTFWADGGGKVRGAATQPLQGQLVVARFVLGVTTRLLPPGARFLVAEVNARSTLLICGEDGLPTIVVSIEVGNGRVQTIWAVANPDKLGGVSV